MSTEWERLLPMTRQELCGRRMVFAEYSAGWAEQRTLVLVVNENKLPSVQVQIALLTDYGSYLGAVDSRRSGAHRHDDGKVCFDLRVQWLPRGGEPASEEQWVGEVALR